MKLSIIIPTLGRDSLKKAVDSVLESAGEDDEILIVADGPDAFKRADKILYDYNARSNADPRVHLMSTKKTTDWAATQMEEGMRVAEGDYICNLGDDDYYTPKACNIIKQGIEEWKEAGGEDTMHLFAADLRHWKKILWGSVEFGEVTGQQWVIPQHLPRAIHDGDYGNDHRFILGTLEALGLEYPVYHRDVISVMARHGKGRI